MKLLTEQEEQEILEEFKKAIFLHRPEIRRIRNERRREREESYK